MMNKQLHGTQEGLLIRVLFATNNWVVVAVTWLV